MSLAVTATDRFVIFSLAGETYAVPVSWVREVVDAPAVTPVPRTHPSIEGIVNLRGNVVPVVHLGRRLGVTEKGSRCVVVVEWHDEVVGLLVDEVTGVRPLEHLQTEGVHGAGGVSDQFVAAVARLEGDRLAVVLDLARVLDLRER